MNYKLVGFFYVRKHTLKTKIRKVKHAIRRWWECRTKRCDYFEHYLAYGPAELTHEGYHAACRRCEEVQRLDAKYMEQHPHALHSPYERSSAEWEKRVRA